MTSRRRPYYDLTPYPEVAALAGARSKFLADAHAVFAGLHHRFASLGASYILPLVPEPEDSNEVSDEVFASARRLAPFTTEAVGRIPYVVSYGFSRVAPGGEIPEHDHWNPYLVALMCLATGDGCHILVGGQRRDFVVGETVLFDYTLPHAVMNPSAEERVVLLCVIDPRRAGRVSTNSAGRGISGRGWA